MAPPRHTGNAISEEMRRRLEEEVEHLRHFLPGQGPIVTFVHHNTLHGFQHLPFQQALKEAQRLLGGRGYWPLDEYRRAYAAGRITDCDLEAALTNAVRLKPDDAIAQVNQRSIPRRELYRIAMRFGITPLDPRRVHFELHDEDATRKIRRDVPLDVKRRLLDQTGRELAEALSRIGRDGTLSHWLHAALGVDLPSQIRADVLHRAHDEPDASRAGTVKASLDALEIPREAREGYLSCIDSMFRSERVHRGTAHDLWLSAEAAAMKRLCRRYFKTKGTVGGLQKGLAERPEAFVCSSLWYASLSALNLDPVAPALPHPLEDRDSQGGVAEASFEELYAMDHLAASSGGDPVGQMLDRAEEAIAETFDRLGPEMSHRDLLLEITGEDTALRVNSYMIRLCAAFLDEGVAEWPMAARALGFYTAWRTLAEHDHSLELDGLWGFREVLRHLPPRPVDAVIQALDRLEIDEHDWPAYLGRVLGELPGWSGMVGWRQGHPDYPHQKAHGIDLMQYLAVRLFHESLLIRRVCKTMWDVDGSASELRAHFLAHRSEFFVRRALFRGDLPEPLAAQALEIVHRESDPGDSDDERWTGLAEAIHACRLFDAGSDRTALRDGWRLFHLAQHLGLSAGELRALPGSETDALLDTLHTFSPAEQEPVWQAAYENHYRDEILQALAENRARGRPARHDRPSAQVVCCIDEREESFRRYVEAVDPLCETFGVAGFFGVAMLYRGLDDTTSVPLCPIVMSPVHEVTEQPRRGTEKVLAEHERTVGLRQAARELSREVRANPISGYFIIQLVGWLIALPLIAKVFSPRLYGALSEWLGRRLLPPVPTRLAAGAPDKPQAASAGAICAGFTTAEQADRVAGVLRSIGLCQGFAKLVVWMGHGSSSMNNPHASAYDCGACGGNHGGHSARLFATMANNPEVRALLADRGIEIPDDSWFVGALHNTCTDGVSYYDIEELPPSHRQPFRTLQGRLDEARALSAAERCRRFESAPRNPPPARALEHVLLRSRDFCQARPELGHVTNACAIVGRRAISQGVFLDRRAFLVSYDPTLDPDGTILEGILLAVGPVCAGMNLEYYFSTVDNTIYGCGTKIPHNVSGLIGVMEGAQGDLRTGLPKQMVEIHEPVRLQMIVEAKPEMLARICARQKAIDELYGNAWVHLVSLDPDSGDFMIFVPGEGFTPCSAPRKPLPVVRSWGDWFRGKTDFVPPALLDPPVLAAQPAPPEPAHG